MDESTEQYFGGKDSIERVIKSYYVNGEKKHSDVHWFFYTGECTAYDSEVQLAEPLTPEEVLLSLKNKALKTLLDNCRSEFCYGDPRVKTYRKKLSDSRRKKHRHDLQGLHEMAERALYNLS